MCSKAAVNRNINNIKMSRITRTEKWADSTRKKTIECHQQTNEAQTRAIGNNNVGKKENQTETITATGMIINTESSIYCVPALSTTQRRNRSAIVFFFFSFSPLTLWTRAQHLFNFRLWNIVFSIRVFFFACTLDCDALRKQNKSNSCAGCTKKSVAAITKLSGQTLNAGNDSLIFAETHGGNEINEKKKAFYCRTKVSLSLCVDCNNDSASMWPASHWSRGTISTKLLSKYVDRVVDGGKCSVELCIRNE